VKRVARLTLASAAGVTGVTLGLVIGSPSSIYTYTMTMWVLGEHLGAWAVVPAAATTLLLMFVLPLALGVAGFRYVWKRS
jgi:integral membrane sensor domain MASE1